MSEYVREEVSHYLSNKVRETKQQYIKYAAELQCLQVCEICCLYFRLRIQLSRVDAVLSRFYNFVIYLGRRKHIGLGGVVEVMC